MCSGLHQNSSSRDRWTYIIKLESEKKKTCIAEVSNMAADWLDKQPVLFSPFFCPLIAIPTKDIMYTAWHNALQRRSVCWQALTVPRNGQRRNCPRMCRVIIASRIRGPTLWSGIPGSFHDKRCALSTFSLLPLVVFTTFKFLRLASAQSYLGKSGFCESRVGKRSRNSIALVTGETRR